MFISSTSLPNAHHRYVLQGRYPRSEPVHILTGQWYNTGTVSVFDRFPSMVASNFCAAPYTARGRLQERCPECHTDRKRLSHLLHLFTVEELLPTIGEFFHWQRPIPLPQFRAASSSTLICATNSPIVAFPSMTSFKVESFFFYHFFFVRLCCFIISICCVSGYFFIFICRCMVFSLDFRSINFDNRSCFFSASSVG